MHYREVSGVCLFSNCCHHLHHLGEGGWGVCLLAPGQGDQHQPGQHCSGDQGCRDTGSGDQGHVSGHDSSSQPQDKSVKGK